MAKKIDAVKTEFRKGDITTVAAIVGCSPSTVRKMLRFSEGHPNHRNTDTEIGKAVMSAYQEILRTRQKLRQAYNQQLKKSA